MSRMVVMVAEWMMDVRRDAPSAPGFQAPATATVPPSPPVPAPAPPPAPTPATLAPPTPVIVPPPRRPPSRTADAAAVSATEQMNAQLLAMLQQFTSLGSGDPSSGAGASTTTAAEVAAADFAQPKEKIVPGFANLARLKGHLPCVPSDSDIPAYDVNSPDGRFTGFNNRRQSIGHRARS
ncbi:hypothetical protein AB1Y20_021419 [Prymnesium parvum]|uniref:Uncharacterized protein n=1 Tax=Prymnesium parvum TaxID=97485 RepID=A0AB34JJL0_PRYPA